MRESSPEGTRVPLVRASCVEKMLFFFFLPGTIYRQVDQIDQIFDISRIRTAPRGKPRVRKLFSFSRIIIIIIG